MGFHADENIGRNGVRRVKVVEVKDDGEIQTVTVSGLKGEFFKLSMRAQPHGITGNPRVGAVGHLFMANGRPDQSFLMNLEHPEDRAKQKDLKTGESKTYGSDGQYVHHAEGGNVIIKSTGGGIVHINPPD